MFKLAASLTVASAILAASGAAFAADTARPLQARLIAAPTFAAHAEATRLVATPAPVLAQPATVARPLHARLLGAPHFAAHAEAGRLVAAKPAAESPMTVQLPVKVTADTRSVIQ